jgi:sigma-B regulation protein RsbU (phosphoserine phosphatase)
MIVFSGILQEHMPRNRYTPFLWAGILVFFFTAIVLLASPARGADPTSPAKKKKQILVLNSYHKGLSWTDNIVRGIESIFPADSYDYEVDFEYMDTKRHFHPEYFKQLARTYKLKYEDSPFDVIIAADNDAFNFARQYRSELFPNVPLIFTGINNFTDEMIKGQKRVTGVVEETDVQSTIDIALKLHPYTREIVVINDRTTTGVAMKKEVLKVMPAFQNRVQFTFFDDFDIPELKDRIRKIPYDSIILLLVVNRDRTGNFFAYEESLAVIYQEATVPIYSVWDFYLGRGIIGGMLTSAYAQGKTAAELALRILEGEAVENIPIVRKSPNQYMFDYRELQRFRVRQAQLPQESIVLNTPDTFYAQNKMLIWGIVATIVFLSVIIVILMANIVERRKIEQALRESEEKYRDLYDNAPDMYHSVDADGVIVECNETEARMLGYEKSDLIGRPISDIFSQASREIHARDFESIKMQPVVLGLEREIVRKDGTTFPASLNVFVELDKNGAMLKTRTIMHDMTERKRVEEQLRNSRELLRNLSAHLQSVREEERRQIASEIHDELGQILTALKLDLSWLKRRLQRDDSDLISSVQPMINLVDKTIEVVQRISSELRPGVLDYLGLIAAIEWQAEEFRKRAGIKCNLSVDVEELPLDQNRSTAVFRIFQETLTNVIRHSGATQVDVMVGIQCNSIVLQVQDNGKGITEDQLTSPTSFGIIGIRERVRFLGGEVRFRGVPGLGTTVLVNIPLTEEEVERL